MGSLREDPERRAELDAEKHDEHGIPMHIRERWDREAKATKGKGIPREVAIKTNKES